MDYRGDKMSKRTNRKASEILEEIRQGCRNMLNESFFRMWMHRYAIEELDRKQNRMIFKSLWNSGTVSCGKVKHLDGPESLFFTGWMTQEYDYMYEPQVIRFVNTRGVPFIPNGEQVVNKDCAIGWSNSGRNPLKRSIEYLVDRMVECELALHTNLLTSQVPFIVNVSPDQQLKASDLIDRLLNYEPVVFTDGDINAIQSLTTGAPWIADKVRALYYDYQSMAYTILGIDNTKMDGSNKQFVLTEQLDANIAEINLFKTDIDESVNEFIDDIEEFSGVHLTLKDNLIESHSIYENDGEGKNPSMKDEEDEDNE